MNGNEKYFSGLIGADYKTPSTGGFFQKDPDKTLDIFGGNKESFLSNPDYFYPGMNLDPEGQRKARDAIAIKEAEYQSAGQKPTSGFIQTEGQSPRGTTTSIKELNEAFAETNKKTFMDKLNDAADKIFTLQDKDPEAYDQILNGLDLYIRGQKGDTVAEAILGNNKFQKEQASALLQSAIAANNLKVSEMKVLKAEKEATTPGKVEKGELEIAKNIIKDDVNKDDIDAVANFIAGRAKTIQLNTGVSFNEAITLAYQLAQQEGGGLKNVASLYGKEFVIDPEGITNVSEADHIKANDEAKAAGQDAYTIGGKTYKVQ